MGRLSTRIYFTQRRLLAHNYNMKAVLLILVAVVVICDANPQEARFVKNGDDNSIHDGVRSHRVARGSGTQPGAGSGLVNDKQFCVTSIMVPASESADAIVEAAQVRADAIMEAAQASAKAVVDAASKSSEAC